MPRKDGRIDNRPRKRKSPGYKDPRLVDLKGNRYGAWTVLEYTGPNENGQTSWLCICDCGTRKIVVGQTLREGLTSSCGCQLAERVAKAKTTHGHAGGKSKPASRTYSIWGAMHARCNGNSEIGKKYYADRGIVVCERWHKFENFLADMGEAPDNMSIDRYPNGAGNYEPGNCRWATNLEQATNKRQPDLSHRQRDTRGRLI